MTDRADTITSWLTGVTHRPGWAISYAGPSHDGRQWVSILACDRDTNNPEHGEFSAMPLFQVTDDIDTREKFLDWLLDVCIPGIDTHERMEWFRVNGKPWRDVHAPGRPAFQVSF